jgi:TonB family protein
MSYVVIARRLALAFAAIAALSGLFATPALADVKAYNQAVSKGDFAAAIGFAEELWPAFDKTLPDTAVIAREFAFTGMRAKQPEKAQAFARWLTAEGPRLPTPDADPQVANVLLQWSLLGPKPDTKHRKALGDALTAWVDSGRMAGPVIPLAASVALYGYEWESGEWKDVQRDGVVTLRIANMIAGADAAYLQESVKLNMLAAKFIEDKDADGFMEIADYHDALMKRMGPIPAGAKDEDDRLYPLDMKAHAWMDSIEAILGLRANDADTKRKRDYKRVTERKAGLANRCGGICMPEPLPPGQLPHCALATWDQTPPISYPTQARYRGIVGTTIIKVATDATGTVTDAKVLAAVPSDVFPEKTIATVLKWKLQVSKLVPQYDPPACTLAGTRTIFVNFRFN